MSPYPWRDVRSSPNVQSFSNDTALEGLNEDGTHQIAVITPSIPHVNTMDPLITSNQTVYRDTQEEEVNPMQVPALSTCRRFLYGLAAPPSAMCGNILGFLMSVYLLEVAKLTPSLVLTISFAGRFWDALSDPLVGYLVTRTNTRWGKCRIWVLVSAPFCGLTFFLFFNTPSWESLYGRFAYYFVVYFAFCTFLTTYHIPYTSMTMLISSRSVDRDAATTLRMIFEMIGTLFGVMTFTFITQHGADRCKVSNLGFGTNGTFGGGVNATSATLSGTVTPPTAEVSPEEEARYRLGAGIIASLVLVCGCVGFFGTREMVGDDDNRGGCCDDDDDDDGKRLRQRDDDGMRATFQRCLRHRPYLLLMLTFMLSSLAIQTVQNSLALYTIHSLKMKLHLKFAIAIVMTTAILATPMVFYLIRRLGKKRVFFVGLFLILPVCVSSMVCPASEAFVPQYYVTMVVAGCYVSINMLLPWIMLPDVIDDYTMTTGRRDEAAFYSLYVFFNKFAVGISTACLQLALHLTGYLQPPACDQPKLVDYALRGMMGPLPILLVLAAFCVLRLYPITPEYRRQLDVRMATTAAAAAVICDSAVSVDLHRLELAASAVDGVCCLEAPPGSTDDDGIASGGSSSTSSASSGPCTFGERPQKKKRCGKLTEVC